MRKEAVARKSCALRFILHGRQLTLCKGCLFRMDRMLQVRGLFALFSVGIYYILPSL